MDPVTALSLVSSVIAIIDFSCKLASRFREARAVAVGRSQTTNDVSKLTENLQQSLTRMDVQRAKPRATSDSVGTLQALVPPGSEAQLVVISTECQKLAQSLVTLLSTFEAQEPGSRASRWRAEARYMRKQGDMADIVKRLNKYKAELQLQVILNIREEILQQAASSADFYQHFDQREQQIVLHLQSGERQFDKLADSIHALRSGIRTDINEAMTKHSQQTHESIQAGFKTLQIQQNEQQPDLLVKIHSSLWYYGADQRQVDVEDAHCQTFQWVLERPKDDTTWPSLVDWLAGDLPTPTYWIAGKPGAGKSTLMKFVLTADKSTSLLQQFAAAKAAKLIVASHFFWSKGQFPLQTSLVGMLRSLLFQVLDAVPEKQALVYGPLCRGLSGSSSKELPNWSLRRLMEAFKRLLNNLDASHVICLLVDGLDECSDDHLDLVENLQTLLSAEGPCVRLVTSSRMWGTFTDAFSTSPTTSALYLHERTASDIERFVLDKMNQNSYFRTLSIEQPYQAEDLIGEFRRKAQGVFIWVKLAVRQVMRSIVIGKTDMASLLREVAMLPRELDRFYSHVLDRIEPDLQKECCVIMLAYYRSTQANLSLSWELCRAIRLHLAQWSSVDVEDTLVQQELNTERWTSFQTLVTNATGALMELRVDMNRHGKQVPLLGSAHLTVSAWLKRAKVQQRLSKWYVGGESALFDRLFRAELSLAPYRGPQKRPGSMLTDYREPEVYEHVYEKVIIFAARLLRCPVEIELAHIELAFHKITTSYHKWARKRKMLGPQGEIKWGQVFWAALQLRWAHEWGFAAVLCDLKTVLSEHITLMPLLLAVFDQSSKASWQSLLKHVSKHDLTCALVVRTFVRFTRTPPQQDLDARYILGLLEAGADVNFKFSGSQSSVWYHLLLSFHHNIYQKDFERFSVPLIESCLKHNAEKFEDVALPAMFRDVQGPGPYEIIMARQYFRPFQLQALAEHGLYNGPIDTKEEWKARARIGGFFNLYFDIDSDASDDEIRSTSSATDTGLEMNEDYLVR